MSENIEKNFTNSEFGFDPYARGDFQANSETAKKDDDIPSYPGAVMDSLNPQYLRSQRPGERGGRISRYWPFQKAQRSLKRSC